MNENFNLDTFLNYINFYRKRIILFFIILIIFVSFFYYFSDDILKFLCTPLFEKQVLPIYFLNKYFQSNKQLEYLIYTSPFEIILVKTKISVVLSLLIFLPIFIFWLINSIKKINNINIIIIIMSFLFYCGMIASYYIFFPMLINVFLDYGTPYFRALWTLKNYINLLINVSFICGIIFEFPLLLICLIYYKIIKIEKLLAARKYIIVAIFIVAAVITPQTDALSQLMVAIPIWIIFEITILMIRLMLWIKK